MEEQRKPVPRSTRREGSIPSRNQGCPLTRNRSVWCYGSCTPVAGRGLCGRLAHHALVGRTQRAIAECTERDGQEVRFDPTALAEPELWRRTGAW